MTVSECVKTLLSNQGTSQRELAEMIGYSGQGSVTTALKRNNGMGMQIDTLIRWLEVLDAQLVVQSDNGNEFVLDGESEL